MCERLGLSDCFAFASTLLGKRFYLFVGYNRNPGSDKGECVPRFAESSFWPQATDWCRYLQFRFVMLVSVSMQNRYCHCVSVFQWRHTGTRYYACILSVGFPDVTSLECHCGHIQQLWTLLVSTSDISEHFDSLERSWVRLVVTEDIVQGWKEMDK
jgi:hypothetical protein